jgi:hypothetical protein
MGREGAKVAKEACKLGYLLEEEYIQKGGITRRSYNLRYIYEVLEPLLIPFWQELIV